jgi:hypothetical protein
MHLPPAHCLALLCVQCSSAGLGFQELNKTICLFYGYLRKPAVAVESVEYVSLGDLLGRQIADEETRTHGKLVPLSFCHKLSLLI